MRNTSPFGRALGLAGLALLLSGCGEADGRVVVRGRLTVGSKAFVLDPGQLKLPPGATALPPGARPLAVAFVADDGTHEQAVVSAETGTFELPGPDGKGLKPGRYRIAVTAGVGGPDYFNNRYAPEKTQIVRDVKEGEEIVIDLTKPQG